MEHERLLRKRIIRFIMVWLIFTCVFLIELYIETYPDFPQRVDRLLAIVLIGIPAAIIVELAFERYVGKPVQAQLTKIGENRLRKINIILLGIIIVPIVLLVFIALIMTAFGK
jgi:hypothetical protein